MRRTSTMLVGILIGCAASLAIAGHSANYPWLVYIFKPLATSLIIGLVLANWISQKQNYAIWITAGLTFSLAGDVLLMWPEEYFVAGLGAFLFAHIAYLAAFTRGVKFPAKWGVWGIYLAIGAGAIVGLSAGVPPELKVPVALYTIAVATMGAQAMARSFLLRTSAARFAAVGGIFFMVSDGLLAVDHFRVRIPYGTVAVLVPYYIAQVLIALSTRHPKRTKPEER